MYANPALSPRALPTKSIYSIASRNPPPPSLFAHVNGLLLAGALEPVAGAGQGAGRLGSAGVYIKGCLTSGMEMFGYISIYRGVHSICFLGVGATVQSDWLLFRGWVFLWLFFFGFLGGLGRGGGWLF